MTIDELLKKATANFAALSPEAQRALLHQQAMACAKAELDWQKAKFRWENGEKVYESYEDYCND